MCCAGTLIRTCIRNPLRVLKARNHHQYSSCFANDKLSLELGFWSKDCPLLDTVATVVYRPQATDNEKDNLESSFLWLTVLSRSEKE